MENLTPKRYLLVDSNRQMINQVGANGYTVTGPLRAASFFDMQSMAIYWRTHGVKTYLKPVA